MEQDNNTVVRLSPLEESDTAEIRALAVSIWRTHYSSFVCTEQIEYMLQDRYTVDDLRPYIHDYNRSNSNKEQRQFTVLRVCGAIAGFLRTRVDDNDHAFFKVEELYLGEEYRGRGYGSLLLQKAESLASKHDGCKKLYLYVNRSNTLAVAVYQCKGFQIVKEQVFDIGHGFVMDDYRMEKDLVLLDDNPE